LKTKAEKLIGYDTYFDISPLTGTPLSEEEHSEIYSSLMKIQDQLYAELEETLEGHNSKLDELNQTLDGKMDQLNASSENRDGNQQLFKTSESKGQSQNQANDTSDDA